MANSTDITIHKVKRYGWVPDLTDARDHLFAAPIATMAALPASVDLRSKCPAVYDQGDLGSCTANAIAGAVEFDLLKEGKPDMMPSRLFVYYEERVIEHTVDSDAGARIRDGIKVVASLGVPPENDWPYNIAEFTQKPPQNAFTGIREPRKPGGRKDGRGTHARPAERDPLGRTAVLAVGYDDSQQRFMARNPWGPQWGMAGYFTMPYSYLMSRNLASDFWTCKIVT